MYLQFLILLLFFAVFESIKIVGSPKPEVLTYSFVFREVMESKRGQNLVSCVTQNGENLWDISYKYGISIDTLVSLNTQIKRPDVVADGSVVRLC